MNWTNENREKEQDLLRRWAENRSDRFPGIEQEETSYFIEKDSDERYIMDYTFDTLPELQKLFDKILADDIEEEVKMICGVAALKRSDILDQNNRMNIVEHRYMF